MEKTCIIIPFYNEAMRFPLEEFRNFCLLHHDVFFCLVDDGSTDSTLSILTNLENLFPEKIKVIPMKENCGKAEAVRTGIMESLNNPDFEYFGFFDADLSTSLDEVVRFREIFRERQDLQLCFGSRIAIIGTVIDRKLHRHLIGRIIATLISNILHLKVYDTQCGAKLFSRKAAERIFGSPFISRWLFDVEIFARLLKLNQGKKTQDFMLEVPVNSWIDKGGSKIPWTYGFRILPELYRIRKIYSDG